MSKVIFDCAHADTCLPDYWGGHHLPHIQIYVVPGMSLSDIKKALRSELSHGAVCGSNDAARVLSWDVVEDEKYADKVTKAAYAAIARIKPVKKNQKKFFTDIEQDENGDSSVYAYFVFREIECLSEVGM